MNVQRATATTLPMKSQERVPLPRKVPFFRLEGGAPTPLLAVLLLAAPPALAQQTPAVTADEATADEATTDSGEVVITDKARAHFRAGVNLLQDPDGARYEEAYRQFKAAYAESPSWKILGNLGVTAMKLEKDGEAIDAFEKYLSEGGEEVTAQEREQFQRDIETLKASVATVRISSGSKGVQLVDERVTNRGGNIRNQYDMDDPTTTLRIRAGHHKITARASGFEESVWEFDASAAATLEHTFDLKKPREQALPREATPADTGTYRPVPLGVWIGVGVTAAFTVGAVATGAIALGKNGEYDDANAEGDPEADDLRKRVKTFNAVTDVLIGAAVVSAIVTTVVYVTRPEKPRPTAWQLVPSAGPQGGSLTLSGTF